MVDIFRGYVATNNKKCIQKFGNGEPLLTLAQAATLPEFAGVLNGEYTVVDIDDAQQAQKMYRLVKELDMNVRVYRTTRGMHFIFHNGESIRKNLTHSVNALGLEFDSRYGKNAYIVLKFNGEMREIVRDFDEGRDIEVVPPFLVLVKGGKVFAGMGEGSGRNSALFTHILTLQRHGFSENVTRLTIRIINEYVFDEPLPDEELQKILRGEAFRPTATAAGDFDGAGDAPIYIAFDQNGRPRVNCPALARAIREAERFFLVKGVAGGVTVFWYGAGVYRAISENELKGRIKRYVTDYSEDMLKMRDVNEVYQILITDDAYVDAALLNADENIINFRNGLLRLDTTELALHSPDVYSTIQIPCDWNPAAVGAPVFERYLDDLTEGDAGKKRLLLQFMGVALSNIKGYRMKKALFMTGRGDTGKSQIKALTERLLGADNYTNIDLSALENRFGTSALWGKRLAGASDMSFLKITELRQFKQMTGGDSIFAEFKGKDGFTFTYNGLLWFCMNALPHFGGDHGKHVYDRIIVLECRNVIPPGRQDRTLLDKLYAEREAIVNMAVHAARDVVANGYAYDIPDACAQANAGYQNENSSVRAFVTECCEDRQQGKYDAFTAKAVYTAYCDWCRDTQGGHAVSRFLFRREVAEMLGIAPEDVVVHKRHGDYYPFTLTAAARKEFGCHVTFPLTADAV